MKNFNIPILITSLFIIFQCKQNTGKLSVDKKVEVDNKQNDDGLLLVKDTTLFINSTQGEDVKLLLAVNSNDSVIQSNMYGEMGKSTYEFVFNKILKKASCITYRYEEPISINSNPKISNEKKEDLATSVEASKRLTAIFHSYQKVLNPAFALKTEKELNSKWFGKYTLTLNGDDDDWRNSKEIELNISSKSVTYLAKGFQLYQYFNLSAEEKNGDLTLHYQNSLDNTESWALGETKNFGTLTLKGEDYKWSSPYLNMYFNDSKLINFKVVKAK